MGLINEIFEKGVNKMNRILYMITVMSILSLVFVAGSQANSMASKGSTTYETTELIGATVKSSDGVELGQIFDVVADSHGHIDFAIVSQPGADEFPGRLVVVPFSTLAVSKGTSDKVNVVFKADKEKFYEGPDWADKNLNNMQQAASVDRYYGIAPYWTQGSEKMGCQK